MLVDTHCHLNFDSYAGDLREVIERALEAEVRWVINPGIDLSTSRAAIELSERFEGVFAAVGVHPNDAASWTPETLEQLRELAGHPKVVAIGEIGLDYYWERTPPALQKEVLEAQLALAADLGLPVILHNRDKQGAADASADMLAILTAWKQGLDLAGHALAAAPGVWHSFGQGWDAAQQALELQLMIGVTGPVTYKNAHALQDVVMRAPLERLVVETDGPFLTPHPHRGARNEPAFVRHIAEKIAILKNLPNKQVEETCTKNAAQLFHLREIL